MSHHPVTDVAQSQREKAAPEDDARLASIRAEAAGHLRRIGIDPAAIEGDSIPVAELDKKLEDRDVSYKLRIKSLCAAAGWL